MSQEEPELPELPPPEEPTGYLTCPVCGAIVKSRGKYAHFRIYHPDLDYKEYKDKFTVAAPPTPPPKPEEPREGEPLYKGELDSTKILRQVLSTHPDVPKRVIDEILSWAEFGPIDPTQLVSLLSSMRGISTTTAYIVAQKYALALQKAQSEGKVQLPPMFYRGVQPQQSLFPLPIYQTPTFQQPYIQPQTTPQIQPSQPSQIQLQPPTQPSWQPNYPNYPTYPQYPQYQPTQDLRGIIRDELKTVEERLRRLEESSRPKEEGFVEIEEPVRDKDGNYIVDDSGRAITRKMKVPASQAHLYRREDAELKALEKMKMWKDILGVGKREEVKPSVTKEDIRLTVKEVLEEKEKKLSPEDVIKIVEQKLSEKTKPEEPEELKTLRRELAENKKKLEELKETLTKKEKEALESRIQSLESDIRRLESERVVEGYHADEYRFMGQGLDKLAGVLEKKEPVKIVIEKLPQLASMTAGVIPQGQAPPPARQGLIEILRQKGLTTQQ